MARWRWAFVKEIIADSIRIERRKRVASERGQEVTKSEFEAGIDSKTVREGQRPAGSLDDGPLVSAGKQERTEAEKEKSLESRERLNTFEISSFRWRLNCSISANPEAISKTGYIP